MVTGEITASDMSAVLDCVYRLHAARGRTQLLTVAAEQLARLLRCDGARLVSVDAACGTMLHLSEAAAEIVIPISNDGEGGVGIRLKRADPGFGEQDRARLDLVRPHLAQAYDAVTRLEALGPAAHDPAVAALTAREREVLDLVGQGLTDRQIALRLHLSDRTVSKHVENLKAKLGVRTRTAAAIRVISARAR